MEKSKDAWYDDAAEYWSRIPATVNGMLGGFGYISQTDVQGSMNFLNQVFNTANPPEKTYALDCGAGIGRVAKNVLLPIFNCVDLVEQNADFVDKIPTFVGSNKTKIGQLYCVGLQDFAPTEQKYDVVWCQWVLGHLKDEDLVDFFQRCKKSLRPNGVIIIKENLTTTGLVECDENDSSVTRPLKHYRKLFQRINVDCFKEAEQANFPKGLYAVRMFALRPFNNVISDSVNNQS